MNTHHLPAPYTLSPPSGWETVGASIWSGQTMVAQCGRQGTEEQKNNAAFIVRACNSHEALIALAEKVAALYEDTDAPIGEQARAALKLAGAA